MKKKLLLFATLLLTAGLAIAQFEGSYILKIEQPDAKNRQPGEMKFAVKGDMASMKMLNADGTSAGAKMIMNSKDRSMIMLMDNNGTKMAMKNKMVDVASASAGSSKTKLTETGKTKVIEGYTCHEVIAENDESKTTMWTTPDLGLSMTDVLGFAGRINEYNLNNGVALETISIRKKDNLKTMMYIKEIKKHSVPSDEFSTDGYQVMEMPPGSGYPGVK